MTDKLIAELVAARAHDAGVNGSVQVDEAWASAIDIVKRHLDTPMVPLYPFLKQVRRKAFFTSEQDDYVVGMRLLKECAKQLAVQGE